MASIFKGRFTHFLLKKSGIASLCFTLLICSIFYDYPLSAQPKRADSLKNRLNSASGSDRAYLLNELAWVYHNCDPELGLTYAGQAKEIFQQKKDLKGEAEALLYMGICYNFLNNNEKAIQYYLFSLRLKERLNDEKGISAILNNLGNIYKDIRDFPHAMESYKKALSISQRLGNQKVIATAMSNIAIICKLQGNFSEAVKWNELAMGIREKINDLRGLSATLNNLSALFADSAFSGKDLRKAIEFIRRSIRIKEEINDRNGLSQSLINLGQILRQSGREAEAIPVILQALQIAKKIGAPAITMTCYESLSMIMADRKDFREAYHYSVLYEKLRDSLFTDESSRKIAEMQVKYETEKKEQENLLLKQKSNIQELQITRQRNQRNFFIILAILIFFLAVAIYSRFILKKRTNALLEEKNNQLAILNATKDKFFSIISHDLKNPFSTLLNVSDQLQQRYAEMTEKQKIQIISLMAVSAKQTGHLLENLLEWSVSQSGSLAMEMESFSLKRVADSCIELVKLNAGKKSVLIFNEIDESLKVVADYNMISTVFRNLLTNAVKFSDKPGSVYIRAIRKDDQMEISVEDEGIGMSEEEMELLFRLDINHTRIGKSGEKGSGLGLILSQEFISRHGGTISVSGMPGKGSKFTFTLKSTK